MWPILTWKCFVYLQKSLKGLLVASGTSSLSLSLFLTHAHALAHTFKHLCSSSHSTCCVTSFDLRSTHTHLVTWICKNTHTLSLSRTLKLTHAPPLSLKHLFLILSNSNTYNYSLKHLRTLTHKHTLTSTHTHTGTHTHVLPHSHTHWHKPYFIWKKSIFFIFVRRERRSFKLFSFNAPIPSHSK